MCPNTRGTAQLCILHLAEATNESSAAKGQAVAFYAATSCANLYTHRAFGRVVTLVEGETKKKKEPTECHVFLWWQRNADLNEAAQGNPVENFAVTERPPAAFYSDHSRLWAEFISM